ncbi:MAG: hypothetical protein QXT45_04345 [Candidatus Bilamarchaeaceae archaeon]
MNLKTYSLFYYGIEVTEFNRWLDFEDDDGEWNVQLPLGGYTLTSLARQIRRSMNSSGTTFRYLVNVNRVERFITIKSVTNNNFKLNFLSGPNSNLGIWDLIGFPKLDFVGDFEYTSQTPIGKIYRPQFYLQNYLDYTMNRTPLNASVNISADGRFVEVIGYNKSRIFKFDIRYITNLNTGSSVIRYRPNAIEEAVDFMSYCTNGYPVEFMRDENDVNNYVEAILLRTATSNQGIGFEITSDYDANLPEFYKIEQLVFREV